ncbi:MAG: glycosyltransferase family 39 protein [Pseudomonadota bacterium]
MDDLSADDGEKKIVGNAREILRPCRIILMACILVVFAIRIPILQTRSYDPDEFQHLHGARQIYHGEIPYRDYFDHHTPLLHYLLATLYPIVGETPTILTAARCLMLVFTVLILGLTFVLAKMLYGVDIGLISVLFLGSVLMFLEKSIEIRPDSGATAFWIVAILFLVKAAKERGSAGNYLYSGLAMGTALMFTQKALFCLPGIVFAILYPLVDRRIGTPGKQIGERMVYFGLGIGIPLSLIGLFFFAHGSFWDFIYCNFIINSQWKVTSSPQRYIVQLIHQNPIVFVLGISGLVVTLIGMHKSDEVLKGTYIPLFCALSVIGGLFIIPVPFRQYFQLFLPLVSIYAAYSLSLIFEGGITNLAGSATSTGRTACGKIPAVSAAILMVSGLIATISISRPKLVNFAKLVSFTHLHPEVLYMFLWIPFVLSAIITWSLGRRKWATSLIAVGLIIYPLDQMIDQLSQKNDKQIDAIEYILDTTSSTEAVLDGWSGYGFLRPHAYYYYFLHREMRGMLNEKQLTDDLISSVEKNNTKIVIIDEDIMSLPKKTKDYIKMKCERSDMTGMFIRSTPY